MAFDIFNNSYGLIDVEKILTWINKNKITTCLKYFFLVVQTKDNDDVN